MSKENTKDIEAGDVIDATIAGLNDEIAALKEDNAVLSESLDKINAKIDEYDARFAAMADKVESSVSFKDADKPKPITDPGVVKIDGKSYKFDRLKFRVPGTSGLVTYLASDVAKDADLCADLLKNHPSVFAEVSKSK